MTLEKLTFRWNVKPEPPFHLMESLDRDLGIGLTLSKLLIQRQIDTLESAKVFFRPDLSQLHDPFLMKDMDKAVKRIESALGNGEKILIYGDYDVDGTTSVALVYSYLKIHTENIGFYIPDRYSEGYGISTKGIDFAKENGYSLIIALDCGIKSIDKIEYANSLGVDFIICDHHTPGEKIPQAYAVLDPKRIDCSYPFKELSGCGIGFKLMQAFCEKNFFDLTPLYELLDLAAVSIACDIVPINGENRILAYFGLKQLNQQPRIGLKVLLQNLNLPKNLCISELVFIIGPRINAAGRMEHGNLAVELLTSKTEEEAIAACEKINSNNNFRRDVDKQITEEALSMIIEKEISTSTFSTVLFNPEWHKGVVGIVASRMIESYYRPTIILTESNGKASGSARSVKGFDVYKAIDACSDLLEQFGGHKYAAGLTLDVANVESFKMKFEQVVASTITEEQRTPEIEIDAELEFGEINPKFYRILKQFAPFGPENMRPIFLSKNLMDTGNSKQVGTDGNHLKLEAYQIGNTNVKFSGIGFGMGKHHARMAAGEPFHLVYSIEENEWKGNISLQLKIRDLKFSL